MSFVSLLFVLATSPFLTSAAPHNKDDPVNGLYGRVVGGVDGLLAHPPSSLSSALSVATATLLAPTTVPSAASRISSLIEPRATESTIVEIAIDLLEAGLTTDNAAQAFAFVDGVLDGENSETNVNLKNPKPAAYPKASPKDASYSLTEQQLRAAIYVPDTFQYGKQGAPQPVILVPGTGATGYTTFVGNYIPLLQGSNIADPVWLNIPGYMLNDAQVNSEYIAYAIK